MLTWCSTCFPDLQYDTLTGKCTSCSVSGAAVLLDAQHVIGASQAMIQAMFDQMHEICSTVKPGAAWSVDPDSPLSVT